MPTVWVYALQFDDGAFYVGMTNNLPRRLKEHSRRQTVSLRRYSGNFYVVYQRPFEDYVLARRQEQYLKSGAGRQELKSVRT